MKKTIVTVSIPLDLSDIVGDVDDDEAVGQAVHYAFELTVERIRNSLLERKLETHADISIDSVVKDAAIAAYDRDIDIIKHASLHTTYNVERE